MMKILFLIVVSLSLNVFAGFSFSNKSSQIKVSSNATFVIDNPINNFSGTLVIDDGGVVSGNSIQFNDGVLADSQSQSGAVEGTFKRDFAVLPTAVDNLKLEGSQSIFINGEVRGAVNISGTGNKISGMPKFANPLVFLNNLTTLNLALTNDCTADIQLAGGAITLDNNLTLTPGIKISSVGTTGAINLNNNTLSLGSVTGNWDDELSFQGPGTINLYSTTNLTNTWNIDGVITITGNGNSLNISDPAAKIIIGAGAILRLNDVTLKGVTNAKLEFTDANSTLELVNAQIDLQANFLQTTGKLITVAESKILMNSQAYFWKLQTPGATFQNLGTTLWLDTGLNDTPAIFGTQTGLTFSSLVDFETVKQVVDFEQVRDASIRYIVSGNVTQNTVIEASFFVQPDETLNFNQNVEVASDGVNINFSNTPEPQFIIESGKTVTFAGNQTLSIYSGTIDLGLNSTLAIGKEDTPTTTQIVINDNFDLSAGSIVVSPGSTLKLTGAGSGQRINLTQPLGQEAKVIDIGFGQLELSNTDFAGLENIVASNVYLPGGEFKQGQIVMGGNTRIRVNQDTAMNFLIRGSGNALVLTEDNITFSGKFSFDPESDNSLEIRFEMASEENFFRVNFGAGTMRLDSTNGVARLIFSDEEVLINNMANDSFYVYGRAFISGNKLSIGNNPIRQYTSDLTLNIANFSASTLTGYIVGSHIDASFLGEDRPRSLSRQGLSINDDKMSNLPKFEPFFYNRQISRAVPLRPQLRIPGQLDTRSARGVLRVMQNGQLNNFSSNPFSPLELQLTGNTTIRPQFRRVKRMVNAVRAINIPNFNDPEYTDRIKETDKIFISGQNNRIFITGNFELKGQLIFDEKAELIFEFDDSVDTPKALKIATKTENGDKGFVLPKGASINFVGAGQVIFENEAMVEFNGDAPVLTSAINGLATFDDNRPSMIFKNYAELAIDLGELITFVGNGQLLFQNNAVARVSNGQLLVGDEADDNFNLSVDRQAKIKVGNFDSEAIVAPDAVKARLSLGSGHFNLNFARRAELQIRSAGVVEMSLDRGVFQAGHVDEFNFYDKSVLDVGVGGRFALAQNSLNTSSLNPLFNLNTKEAEIVAGGIVSLYSAAATTPFIEGLLQGNKFNLSSINPFELFKGLVRYNSTSKLIQAVDFFDAENNYKLLLYNNTVTALKAGDSVRSEGVEDKTVNFGQITLLTEGAVFGTAANGLDFVIAPRNENRRVEYARPANRQEVET